MCPSLLVSCQDTGRRMETWKDADNGSRRFYKEGGGWHFLRWILWFSIFMEPNPRLLIEKALVCLFEINRQLIDNKA